MNGLYEAGTAIYVAMAVALSVWIGIFVYLWRIDAQARALKRELQREHERLRHAETGAPRASVTRVGQAEGEPVEQSSRG
ncbi:MAG: CcmD family protein [Oscillochloridaceae bacterium]|nr:CcmD family protein [Chloroflexaceae bacterium]MDW8391847.1 CcmD family protein [Oscillochloridaceae bacterium]